MWPQKSLSRWYTIVIILFFATFYLLVTYGPQKQKIQKYEKNFYNKNDMDSFQQTKGITTWEEYLNLRKNDGRNHSNVGRMLYFGEKIKAKKRDAPYLILMWKYGKFLERRLIRHFSDKKFDPFENCSVKNCIITYNDSALKDADLVIVHLQQIKSRAELPLRTGNKRQMWAFLTDESPYHTFLYPKVQLKEFNGIFNWSMNYRMDADIPVPYGRTVPLEKGTENNFNFEKWNTNKKQDVLVTTLSSNCNSQNNRLNYITELGKHVKIDTYGKCGTLTCDTGFYYGKDCLLLSKYKFYLAFENTNCDEYITEKLWWQGYHKETVPIVMGASRETYKRLLPPKSYLNIEDFASPKALADYIIYLNKTPSAMATLFKWKDKFKVVNEHGYFQSDSFHYCRACEALNYNDNDKVYNDLESFWSKNDCHPSWNSDLNSFYINI